MKNSALALLLIIYSHVCIAANPESPKVITLPSHTPKPLEHSTIHFAKCPTSFYRLEIDYMNKTAKIVNPHFQVDISRTTLATTIFNRSRFTRIGFNCPVAGLNIFVAGIELDEQNHATGLQHILTIKENGTINEYGGDSTIDVGVIPR